jgi:hypothetical protein
LIEIVGTTDLLHVGVELIGADEGGGLFGMNGVGLAAAGDFAFTADYGDNCGVTVFVDGDAIRSGTKDGKGEIGRVNLEGFVLLQTLHADPKRTFGELDLRDVVIEIEKREAGGATDAKAGGADVKFGAGSVVGPEFVSGGHGAVDDGVYPIVGAGGIEGYGAVGMAEAGDATRWIVVRWRTVLILSKGAQRCEERCGTQENK